MSLDGSRQGSAGDELRPAPEQAPVDFTPEPPMGTDLVIKMVLLACQQPKAGEARLSSMGRSGAVLSAPPDR